MFTSFCIEPPDSSPLPQHSTAGSCWASWRQTCSSASLPLAHWTALHSPHCSSQSLKRYHCFLPFLTHKPVSKSHWSDCLSVSHRFFHELLQKAFNGSPCFHPSPPTLGRDLIFLLTECTNTVCKGALMNGHLWYPGWDFEAGIPEIGMWCYGGSGSIDHSSLADSEDTSRFQQSIQTIQHWWAAEREPKRWTGPGAMLTTALAWASCSSWPNPTPRQNEDLLADQYRRRKWQPTPVFMPGESQGWGSLVGCHLWGRTESDTTEAT